MTARYSVVRAAPALLVSMAALWISGTSSQSAAQEAPRPPAEVPGITPEVLVRVGVPGAFGKLAVVTRVTYEPGARNRKHYHTSQIVFYIIEGAMVVQEEGKEPMTLKAGDSLLIKPGTVHAHWNASTTAKLVFTEFILVDEGQRSTVVVE